MTIESEAAEVSAVVISSVRRRYDQGVGQVCGRMGQHRETCTLVWNGFALRVLKRFPGKSVMSRPSPSPNIEFEQWERNCREQLRDRYLEKLSSKDMLRVYQQASSMGWSLTEGQREIDKLLRAKAIELGQKPPC
jgi:hypothetical protein